MFKPPPLILIMRSIGINIGYVYMHTNFPLLFQIWPYSEIDTGHVNGIFFLDIPSWAPSEWSIFRQINVGCAIIIIIIYYYC